MTVSLVTGAPGLVGSHVTRLLVERGDSVRVVVRPASNLENLAGLDVERVVGDVLDRRSVRRAMRGVSRVFHVAGMTSLRASRHHEDTLEATVAWYRERGDGRLAPEGTRQPLGLRVAGSALRRAEALVGRLGS